MSNFSFCPSTLKPSNVCECFDCTGIWPQETSANRLMDSPDSYGAPYGEPFDHPHDEMDNPPGREW